MSKYRRTATFEFDNAEDYARFGGLVHFLDDVIMQEFGIECTVIERGDVK